MSNHKVGRRIIALSLLAAVLAVLVMANAQSQESAGIPSSHQPDPQKLSVDITAPFDVTVSSKTEKPPQNTADKNRMEPFDAQAWLNSFLFDFKITDFILVLFAAVLWWGTEKLWQATLKMGETSLDQADNMKAAIAESARAANALQKVAESIAINTQAVAESINTNKQLIAQQRTLSKVQMRAYLSVHIGEGHIQDSKRNFEINPLLINNGSTPAHTIRYWAQADILPWPLSPGFIFPQPDKPETHIAFLAPGHKFTLHASMVPDRVAKEKVEEIVRGTGEAQDRLCIWGKATYDDVFGTTHTTSFCHSVVWAKGSKKGEEILFGEYGDRHNGGD